MSFKSGQQIETCYFCSIQCSRSSCYNIQIGYDTIFCCSIECCTIINAYLYASSHYKSFSFSNIDKAVDHYCYSNKCRASDYNLNVSLIKRCLHYYCSVRFCGVVKDPNHVSYLLSDNRYNDEWSQDDPY